MIEKNLYKFIFLDGPKSLRDIKKLYDMDYFHFLDKFSSLNL